MNALPMPGVRLAFEEGGALARVVFDGGKGNVIDRPLLRDLARALREAEASHAKAVLIEGAGDHFSFGASVEEHRPAKVRDFLREFHTFFRELIERPLPRIAVVRGQCLGGGLELALACQKIFAARGAKLGQPEIKLAVFAPVASLLLPQRVGQPAVDDLLLTGRSVAAEEALARAGRFGLRRSAPGRARLGADAPAAALGLVAAVRGARGVDGGRGARARPT